VTSLADPIIAHNSGYEIHEDMFGTWTFNWTASATAVGTIRFGAAGNLYTAIPVIISKAPGMN
jgi:hypothetical protein